MTTENFPTLKSSEPIGNITIKEDSLVVGREDKEVTVYVRPAKRDGVRVGDYIRIPYKDSGEDENDNPEATEMMFGVINQLEYRQRGEYDDYQDYNYDSPPRDKGEQNLVYVARVEPIAILTGDENSVIEQDEKVIYPRSSVSRPPRPGDYASIVQDKPFLQSGLKIPTQGEIIGHLSVGGEKIPDSDNPLQYMLSNPPKKESDSLAPWVSAEPQMFRHTFVMGSTGQGKTHFSKNILRQFATGKRFTVTLSDEEIENLGRTEEEGYESDEKLNVTIFDPEDEYAQMKYDPKNLSDEKRKEYEEEGLEVGGLEDGLTAWRCKVAGSQNKSEGESFTIPFEVVEGRADLLISAEPGDRTRNAVHDLVQRYFDDEQGNPTYERFLDFAHNRTQGLEVIQNESVQEAVSSRIDRHVYKRIFDQDAPALTDVADAMFKRGGVTVFPLRHLRGEAERLVVLCIMSYIVDNQLDSNPDNAHINSTPMLLCIDEAHKYLGEPETIQDWFIVSKFRDVARRGRKECLGLYIVTQNPQDIDAEIQKQINTNIYLGLDSNIVESNDVHVPRQYRNRIKELNKGEAVVEAPDVRPVEIKGFSNCFTRHET